MKTKLMMVAAMLLNFGFTRDELLLERIGEEAKALRDRFDAPPSAPLWASPFMPPVPLVERNPDIVGKNLFSIPPFNPSSFSAL